MGPELTASAKLSSETQVQSGHALIRGMPGPKPYRDLRMQLGTHGPEHMPGRLSDRMPMKERLPDRMSEYMSDKMQYITPDYMPERMPNRMSEYMSNRMPDTMSEYVRIIYRYNVSWYRSKKASLFEIRSCLNMLKRSESHELLFLSPPEIIPCSHPKCSWVQQNNPL